ncbi:hypothetical protein MycrhDRAFT_4678 [Mycolicibacterium rhodesiae JS60]|nr:hypothetical protein MycrhDRAFT_4678 [Mycolicibacterium rhodesiae JS60]
MTPHQTRKNCHNSTLPAATPRLRLKPKASRSGSVDGAWWPRSDELAVELPDLLAVLSVRLGRIDRVLYRKDSWAKSSRRLVTGGAPVRLDGYQLQLINTIEVLGMTGGRITLLVVPPHTDAGDAHTTMMAAARADDTGAVAIG